MKKQPLLLMLLAVLFTATITTSCSKKNDAPTDDNTGGGGGGGTPVNPNLSKYLQGSDYYLISLDATSEKAIHAKVKKDFRTDDKNMFLYIWEQTYSAGTSSGPNAFGEVEGWTSFVVGKLGWAGAGFAAVAPFKVELGGITDKHVLHIAIKSKEDVSFVFTIADGTTGTDGKAVEAKFNYGVRAAYDVQPSGNFKRDGEWQHIEIPVADLKTKGLRFPAAGGSVNAIAILTEGKEGAKLDVDGIFYYVPKS